MAFTSTTVVQGDEAAIRPLQEMLQTGRWCALAEDASLRCFQRSHRFPKAPLKIRLGTNRVRIQTKVKLRSSALKEILIVPRVIRTWSIFPLPGGVQSRISISRNSTVMRSPQDRTISQRPLVSTGAGYGQIDMLLTIRRAALHWANDSSLGYGRCIIQMTPSIKMLGEPMPYA